jgi:hypothetical protein
MNIFENATRSKFRFESQKGSLSTEQLWDLPLTGACSLDAVGRQINRFIKDSEGESLVTQGEDPAVRIAKLRLEVVKHIIAVKLNEKNQAAAAMDRRTHRMRLLDEKAKRADDRIGKMTDEDLDRQLAELSE